MRFPSPWTGRNDRLGSSQLAGPPCATHARGRSIAITTLVSSAVLPAGGFHRISDLPAVRVKIYFRRPPEPPSSTSRTGVVTGEISRCPSTSVKMIRLRAQPETFADIFGTGFLPPESMVASMVSPIPSKGWLLWQAGETPSLRRPKGSPSGPSGGGGVCDCC